MLKISKNFSKKRIYADAAAATPIHPRVMKRMVGLYRQYANPGALHKDAVEVKKELQKARTEIADAIGAHADEIYFTGSGTEANNLALQGVLRPLLRERKVRAITLPIEHQSVIEPLQYLKKYDLDLIELPVNEGGLVNPSDLKEAINDKTALISIQLVNSEVGVIEPLRELMRVMRHARKEREAKGNKLPLYFHTDAAQAPLYVAVHVEKLGVDLMTLDAQKVLGPKGIGVLYRRRGVEIESLIIGGRQERGLRAGTENMPLAAAFGEALMLAQQGVEKRAQKVSTVRDYLIDEIKKVLPDAQINGPFDKIQGKTPSQRVANNINVSISGLEGETAVIAMDALGISISTRSACVTRDEEPSHVIKALGHSRQRAREAIRITLVPTVTKNDARRIAQSLKKVADMYRVKD